MKIADLEFVTPRKAKQFENKGIETVEELLKIVPKKYFDCRESTPISPASNGQNVCIIGKTTSFLSVIGKDTKALRFWITDDKNNKISVLWFNQMFLYNKLDVIGKDEDIIVFGKITYNEEYKNYSISNPTIFSNRVEEHRKIFPIYKKISGVSEEYYKEVVDGALKVLKVRDYLTKSVREEFGLCEYNSDFFRKIHSPNTIEEVGETQRRLIFDDLFYFASRLYKEERETPISDFIIERTDLMQQIIRELPFDLTGDQKSTVDRIVEKAKDGERINALVQGDVGCGKTIVSFLSMIAFAENGYQSALMAPTQVLAKQHYEGLTELVSKYGLRVAYLHSGMKVREKKKVCDDIKTGWYHFVVGTHSVFANSVEYDNLGLVITDEEHKFGVEQRDSLVEKASNGVHTITMSATPIPRTLAITLYGESKEVFTINQMPSGRKPVITGIAKSDERTFSFMRNTIKRGQQCYVVCPLIKDSDSEKMEGVESVENIYSRLVEYFSDDEDIKIEMLTGKQSSEEVENTISRFSKNETQILISTTVIEVGVNVPNASVIVIRNAERFGLAQLHQLRGRVGRGVHQSYCVLCSEDENNMRLSAMCATTNGFEIANADLKNRGTGDLIGTRQSGENKYVELMLKYPTFYLKIKNKVKEFIEQSNMLR